MEDYSENYSAPQSWFNSHLFFIDDRPMKFSLHGYNQLEFRDIVRIIEAYGGKLSSPDDETMVFSEPHRFSEYDGDLYHIKFLYDSIQSHKLLNISLYRLTPHRPETPDSSHLDHQSPYDLESNVKVENKDELSSDTEISESTNYATIQEFLEFTKDDPLFKSPCKLPVLPDTDISSDSSDEDEVCVDAHTSARTRIYRKFEAKPVELTGVLEREGLEMWELNPTVLLHTLEVVGNKPKFVSSVDNKMVLTPKESTKSPESAILSANESRDHLTDDKMASPKPIKRRKLHKSSEIGMKSAESSEDLIKFHNSTDFSGEIDEESNIQANKRKNTSLIDRYIESLNNTGKNDKIDKKQRKKDNFTKQEDEKIIKYLIDNNAIKIDKRLDFWRKMEISLSRKRTACSIEKSFS